MDYGNNNACHYILSSVEFNMTIIKFEISYKVSDTRKAIKRAISDIEEDLRIGDYNTDEQILVDNITAKEYFKRKKP